MKFNWSSFLIGTLLLVCVTGSHASHWIGGRFIDFCPKDFVRVEALTALPIRIPVGCEIIDCCPGCPKPEFLSWRINFDGQLASSITVRFERLPNQNLEKFTLEGPARTVGNDRIVVSRGTTHIMGLPGALKQPIIGVFKISLKTSHAASRENHFMKVSKKEPITKGVALVVEQLLDNVVVNKFQFQLRPRDDCPPEEPPGVPVSPSDFIFLYNNLINDSANLSLTARDALPQDASDCDANVPIQHYSQLSKVSVGNILEAQGCRSELAIFSDDNAVKLVEQIADWTDKPGDIVNVKLGSMVKVPITVWVPDSRLTSAKYEVDRANTIFNSNHAGIVFEPNFKKVSSTFAMTVRDQGAGIGECSPSAEVPKNYDPMRINVYYGLTANTAWVKCRYGVGKNIIYLGTKVFPETLAHEFGHAFHLLHEYPPDVSPSNLMIPRISNRADLTEGQAFVMNIHEESAINQNQTRVGPKRDCSSSHPCMPVSWDMPN